MFDHFIKLEIAEAFEQRRVRELESERIRLEAEGKDLDQECRIFVANFPAPHNPAAQYLREMGWGNPHPLRTALEEKINDWLRRWSANRNEYAKLV